MNNALTTTNQLSDELQASVTMMAQHRNAMVALTKEIMVKEQDFGIIPGTPKPTLLKPGAEKLMRLFNLSVKVEAVEKIFDIDRKYISYTYRASILNKDDRSIAQCEGSVNSFESKYRYIWAERFKPDQSTQDKMKAEGTGKFKKGASGWVWVERIENPDILGMQNTIQKMAQKRAYVGAVLLATNASEFFSQDLEDMDFIDVEATIIETKVNQEPEVKKKKELLPGTDEWNKTVKALQEEKTTIEKLKQLRNLSPENEIILVQAMEEAA